MRSRQREESGEVEKKKGSRREGIMQQLPPSGAAADRRV